MKEEKTLEAIVKRCQGECYVGMVGKPAVKSKKTNTFEHVVQKIIFSLSNKFK